MKATNIKWETDGQNVQLPSEIEIPSYISADDEDAITDYLSDETGWLVISYDIEDTEADVLSAERNFLISLLRPR